jgi:hypothetical protein
VRLWPTIPAPGSWRETELESRATETLRLPLLEPGAIDPGPGVNTAVTCAGDAAAAKDVSQAALVLVAELTAPVQPAIGAPWFSNVTVPAMEPALLTSAKNVTGWLVTRELEEATSDVLLGVADWMRVSWLDATLPSSAVNVVVAGDRTTVLVKVTLHVPLAAVVQLDELGETGAPLVTKSTAWPANGCRPSVTVALAVVVELPFPRIVDGFRGESVTAAGPPAVSVRVACPCAAPSLAVIDVDPTLVPVILTLHVPLEPVWQLNELNVTGVPL